MSDNEQTKINIEDTTSVTCTVCSSEIFKERLILRKVPATKAPSGKEEVHPVKIIMCDKCKTVVK